ncbi:Serine/threonine-protein kinase D3 [Takifugu flavidus]|uniref:Serine/threonine-protein kinase D3 n=1 Tax=Takifugu flavidus TaxID=433684 RepID=A0A5C6NXT5_9TELE|nr:Serine/threonine-protein kinase D3 [Takifugu flavidus]
MSASSPPSLPRAFLHSLNPHRPSSPSSWPSPSGPIYMRLSNGSHSVPSPTNSRGSFHGVSFLLQIGLTRETVNLEASDLSLSAVKDLVCSIVDQKLESAGPRVFDTLALSVLLFPPLSALLPDSVTQHQLLQFGMQVRVNHEVNHTGIVIDFI